MESSASTNNNNSKKTSTDTDLKGSIIEFMRSRPFLWNSKHPNYKDHKRRENEFQAFSEQIGHSVQEIKRVWHVLRTNFFRAHKLLMERPHGGSENGEKLWKYYLAMEYILEGTVNNDDSIKSEPQQPQLQHQQQQPQPQQQITPRSTRSSKVLRDSRGDKSHKHLTTTTNNVARKSSSGASNNNNTSLNSSSNSNIHNTSIASTFNESLDTDDDHLYARSLTSTLKKFDPMTKERIKLKFQEIIVSYMQESSSSTTTTTTTTTAPQLSQPQQPPSAASVTSDGDLSVAAGAAASAHSQVNK